MILQRHFNLTDTVLPAADTLSSLNAAISVPGVTNALNAAQFPTWLQSYEQTILPSIAPAAAVGTNLLLASRIVSDALMHSAAGRRGISDLVLALPADTYYIFQLLAGGAVNGPKADDTAVHPAWRASFGFADVVVSGATPGVSAAQQSVLDEVRARSTALYGTAVYYNENAPGDGWQDAQWGANYARLLAVKTKYDPTGVLSCRACVGSEVFGY